MCGGGHTCVVIIYINQVRARTIFFYMDACWKIHGSSTMGYAKVFFVFRIFLLYFSSCSFLSLYILPVFSTPLTFLLEWQRLIFHPISIET